MTNPSEAQTRRALIDPALRRAGWDVQNPAQVGLEIPVDGVDPAAWQALRAQIQRLGGSTTSPLPTGISDYVLYQPNGSIIAVVEAKKTIIDPRLAEAQVAFYVEAIAARQGFKPFAFLTNGHDIYFWDVGHANKRLVQGFFSPDDLANLHYLREHQIALTTAPINTAITNRAYQQEAVRRVSEVFAAGRRKALLVMATGTGKTRTVMSLVDIFLRTNQARRILFVADRDALVQQAMTEGFQSYIPNEPATRIFAQPVEQLVAHRLFVATLQTMSNRFRDFTPGFFDLIIFDEVHRSIFNKWNEILHYYDGRMIGLTATPAHFIERNTFLSFECDDHTPTFLYNYEEAIKEGYLVDFSLYVARTKFQRRGIRGVDLGEEERNALIDQGIDPDEIDFSGSDLEKTVSNLDTIRKQWAEFMEQCYRDAGGQLPGKTIVFAMTQEHALRLADVFERMYPQYPDLVKVITYKSEYKGRLIDQFKHDDRPRIAISVDMLETGVNIPEIVNLVFMRPVQSRIKIEQMLGRGTRSNETCTHPEWLPDGHKREFLVIDYWENDFSKTATDAPAQSLPVLVTIFNTRLRLIERYLGAQQSGEAQRTIADLRAMIARIPRDSFAVKQLYSQIEHAWQDSFWLYLTSDKLTLLRLKVGPLLRYAADVDVEAETFTSKVERLKLQVLTGKSTVETAQSIAEDVSYLPDSVLQQPQRRQAAELCLSTNLQTATPTQLDQVIDLLAGEMHNRRKKQNTFLTLDLPDFTETRGYILLHGGSQPVYIAEYRRRVEERIDQLVGSHPTIHALDRHEPVSDAQLIALERTLRQELGGNLELSEANIRKAFNMKVGSLLEFLRQLLDLDGIPDYQEIVRRQFEHYIGTQPFSADQIRFLRAVQTVLLQKRRLSTADLYDDPLTNFGADAVERLFTLNQRDDLLHFANSLAAIGA